MTRLNLKQDAKLHNKHHIVLTDAKTGEVKQEGWAYNAILDQGFTRLLDAHFAGDAGYAIGSTLFGNGAKGWGGQTYIGSGTTAVSITDTALASPVANKVNSFSSRDYDIDNLQASQTRKAVWNETEVQNTTITEVGLGTSVAIVTRALIKDSEGNQITINKGTTDILTIYSTVFIELSHGYGSSFGFVGGVNGNALLKWVSMNAQWPLTTVSPVENYGKFCNSVGSNKDPVSLTDEEVKSNIYQKWMYYNDVDVSVDSANKKIKLLSLGTGGGMRFGSTEGNSITGVFEIGARLRFRGSEELGSYYSHHPLFRAVLPLAGVWSGTTITDEELGTGDSTTTIFQTTWAPVLSGTDVVKIDGVTQTRDTDYTINLATGEITFTTTPATGLSVTCTYGIEQIPKDSNHVLDIGFTIQFADGSV